MAKRMRCDDDGSPSDTSLQRAIALERRATAEGAGGAADAQLRRILARWHEAPLLALGLDAAPPDAAALQRAYLRVARICHPDKGGAHRVFLAITAARDQVAHDAGPPSDAPAEPAAAEARSAPHRGLFGDDPLFGAVHDDFGYESRFWGDDPGGGKRDRAAMWARFDADFDERRRAREAGAAAPLG